MPVAPLYDIHGNLPALEAVLDEVAEIGVDCVVIGGDVVPGPLPRATLAALLRLPVPAHFLHGNGETDVIAATTDSGLDAVPAQARDIVSWTSRILSASDMERLMSWPASVELDVPGIGTVLFCHATPRSDREIFTEQTPAERLQPIFENVTASVVVCGHTHMQFDRTIGATRVVNAGSVGMRLASRALTGSSLGQVSTCGAPITTHEALRCVSGRRTIRKPLILQRITWRIHRRPSVCWKSWSALL